MTTNKTKKKSNVSIWLKVPAALYITIFNVVPLIIAIVLSLHSGHGNNLTFCAFDNIKRLISDNVFIETLLNTSKFILIIVPASVIVCLVLCYGLFKIRASRIARLITMVLYLPCITSPVAYSLFFKQIAYSDSGFPQIMKLIIGNDFNILQNAWSATIYVSVICLWSWTGFFVLLLYSSMQSVNTNVIKSAYTDGAKDIRIFVSIIVPQMKHVIFLILILCISSATQIYTEVALITKGGPGSSTQTLSLYLYRKVFTYVSDFGYASLLGLIVLMISTVLIVASFILKKNEKK